MCSHGRPCRCDRDRQLSKAAIWPEGVASGDSAPELDTASSSGVQGKLIPMRFKQTPFQTRIPCLWVGHLSPTQNPALIVDEGLKISRWTT
jgi:hypothetical protein